MAPAISYCVLDVFVPDGAKPGSVLGLAGTPHLTEQLGWSSAFYIFGVAGIVWVAVWLASAASTPQVRFSRFPTHSEAPRRARARAPLFSGRRGC